MKKPIQIKVDDADLAAWNTKADEAGLSLSAWIRERCNADSNGQAVRGTDSTRVAERSSRAPGKPKLSGPPIDYNTLRHKGENY
jgi:hypothetical protein